MVTRNGNKNNQLAPGDLVLFLVVQSNPDREWWQRGRIETAYQKFANIVREEDGRHVVIPISLIRRIDIIDLLASLEG